MYVLSCIQYCSTYDPRPTYTLCDVFCQAVYIIYIILNCIISLGLSTLLAVDPLVICGRMIPLACERKRLILGIPTSFIQLPLHLFWELPRFVCKHITFPSFKAQSQPGSTSSGNLQSKQIIHGNIQRVQLNGQ